ncbi:hypothetical protein [Legionella bozemanae]|uniref:hypothetical protein n=1 Tax=Legionella bozemanae TaxID=447 RepID=UPI000730E3F1|nr:hypothetical protein [Legionella bozemanae]
MKGVEASLIKYNPLYPFSSWIIRNIEKSSSDIKIEILPGISSLDCLFCDLRVDPGSCGIQAYESTEFINK